MVRKLPIDVVNLICGPILIYRVGLWLMPLHLINHELDEAARLWIEPIDISKVFLEQLPKNTSFTGLSYNRLIELIDYIATDYSNTECGLIYNIDILLARLPIIERRRVWGTLLKGFPHRPKALLIGMPENATHLLPLKNELEGWVLDNRLA